jgi:hypothetical protein
LLLASALLGCDLPKSNDDPPFDAGAGGGAPDAGRPQLDAGRLEALEPGFTDTCLVGPFEIGPDDPVRSIQLPPVNQHLCALSGVEGPLASEDDAVSLAFDESTYEGGQVARGVRWILSASAGARATAWCARVQCFVDVEAAGKSLSGPLEVPSPRAPIRPFTVAGVADCNEQAGALWEGDASAYVTELQGTWSSRDQRVSLVIPSQVCADARTGCMYTTFYLRNCASSGVIGARGHSYIAGIPHQPARFVGPMGTGTIGEVSEFVADTRYERFLTLTDGTSGICMLTGFSGSLARAGDSVDIVPMRDELGRLVWTMSVRAAGEPGIEARALCYTYEQE